MPTDLGAAPVAVAAAAAGWIVVQDTTARDTTAGDTTAARADTVGGDGLNGEPFPDPDPIMQRLLQKAGYRPIVYQGDTLRFSTGDRSIRIRERARLERMGDQLTADSVVYRSETRQMTAFGRSRLVNAEGEEVTSEEGPLFYHTERRIGTIMNARTQWDIWRINGNFTLEGSDTLWVRSGVFTSCDLPEPHYHFSAGKIKMILGHIVVAWPVTLYFGDVPVFWLPFFAQDVRRGRHSGILTPRFGVNDIVRNSRSIDRHVSNVGYYWAISDFMDAQVSLDWWSSRWTRIDGFYRYRWRRKFIDGRIGVSQFFLPDGAEELSLTWNHAQKFGERSDLRASVQFISSQQFQQQNEFDPDRLVQQIRSDVGFTRRFDWGTLNLSGQRLQPLTEGGRTTLDLPQASLTLSPLVLTPAPTPLQARWYHGLTLNGSTNFSRQFVETAGAPDQTTLRGTLTSGLSLGNFRQNSSATYNERVTDKPDTLISAPDTVVMGPDTVVTRDTTIIGENVREGTLNWRSGFAYQQRLVGSTSLTPSVDLSGSFFRSNETDLALVPGPARISMNATLNTDVFGFFPGVGPAERIRHKFSPSFRWSYSPEVTPSPEVAGLRSFNPGASEEIHRISMSLAQTFEARLKPSDRRESADTTPTDTARARTPAEDRKITLLAIRTTALTYDFATGRLTTDRITNNFTSDLLRGLTIRTQHDLFAEGLDDGRDFDPFLTELNLSFSLGDRQFRDLFGRSQGISRGRGLIPESRGIEDDPDRAPADEPEQEGRARRQPWSLGVDYSLIRSRPLPDGAGSSGSDRQSLHLNLGFSPTPNWTVRWRTQFDITEGRFVDHVVGLQRDLHRWSANFDFLRAANGNFVFEFRVNLNDLPDLKFDYRQESETAQFQ